MLEQVVRSEQETIKRYVDRMRRAEECGDHGLANDLQGIVSEETRHKEEAEKLLSGSWPEGAHRYSAYEPEQRTYF